MRFTVMGWNALPRSVVMPLAFKHLAMAAKLVDHRTNRLSVLLPMTLHGCWPFKDGDNSSYSQRF
jgi:hypothetical protein